MRFIHDDPLFYGRGWAGCRIRDAQGIARQIIAHQVREQYRGQHA